ncbi:MAG TPA: hypothetical protein VKN18_31980 [Blastocatellia bacterium]|nr:hypothetical protein [Blastocatellia bacterium]
MIKIYGSMGILTGFLFALLVSIRKDIRTRIDLSLLWSITCGILGSALVQVAYLGNTGDTFLSPDEIGMALAISTFSAFIAAIWFLLARRWAYSRSAHSSRG